MVNQGLALLLPIPSRLPATNFLNSNIPYSNRSRGSIYYSIGLLFSGFKQFTEILEVKPDLTQTLTIKFINFLEQYYTKDIFNSG